MSWQIIFKTVGAVLFSVGGASVIIVGLSSWLGKVWANRILEADKAKYNREIESLKNEFSKELDFYRSQIEMYKITLLRYSEHQFSLYNKLWVSLVDLKIAGDRLWEQVDKDSVLDFGAKVKKAKDSLLQNALLIEENHENKLNDLLEKFSNYQAGKDKLIELDRKMKQSNTANLWPNVIDAITRHNVIQNNDATKKAYDELLISIKASFRKQLKEGLSISVQT